MADYSYSPSRKSAFAKEQLFCFLSAGGQTASDCVEDLNY